ncbi:MAG: hypothetical protein ACKVHE_01745 [Planctomycetales bacterium]
MASLGGWAELAKQFRAEELPSGKAFRFRSGSVGMASYGGCLTLRLTDSGLHISVGLFGIPLLWHPPLLIPWSEFHSTTKRKFIFWTSTLTYISMPVIAHMTLPEWVSDYIDCEDQPARRDHKVESPSK